MNEKERMQHNLNMAEFRKKDERIKNAEDRLAFALQLLQAVEAEYVALGESTSQFDDGYDLGVEVCARIVRKYLEKYKEWK